MSPVFEAELKPTYDENYSHLHEIVERSHSWMARIKDMQILYGELARPLELGAGSVLLDIGSGIGRPGHYLRHIGVETINIDINTSAQQAAQTLWKDTNEHNYNAVGDGAESLPLKNGSIDAICSQDFFEHINPTQLDTALQEMERVLSGNKMVHRITVMEEPDNLFGDLTHQTFWSAAEWKSWFAQRGWTTIAPTTRRTYAPRANLTGLTPYCHGYFLLERNT